MNGERRRQIAARLRELLAAAGRNDPASAARELGVDEVSLRMSIDELTPYPTIDVLGAVASYFGVDPTYILTGQYDPTTHRHALELDADGCRALFGELVQRETPTSIVSRPTPESNWPIHRY